MIFRKTKEISSSFVHEGEGAGRSRVPSISGNHIQSGLQVSRETWLFFGLRFGDLAKLVFALSRGVLRLSSVINIDQKAGPTQNRAIAGSQRFSVDLEPPISTVRSSKSADCIG